MCEGENAGGFAGAGRTGENEVGHVAVASDDLEARDGVLVADDVGDLGGSVLLHPWDVVADGGVGGG